VRPTEGCPPHGCVVTDLTVFFHVAGVVGGVVASRSTAYWDRLHRPNTLWARRRPASPEGARRIALWNYGLFEFDADDRILATRYLEIR
jgi:hypothetical protein